MSGQQRTTDPEAALKVEIGTSSVSVDVKGTPVVQASDALFQIISPFTQAAGWLGDQLSYARRAAAIRAAAKAAAQLRSEGVFSARIPPKILLPWLEGASLETDEQEENLTDAWAGLFVSAAKSSDAVTTSYIETLKKLGKKEASLLQFFATDTSPTFGLKFYDNEEFHIFSDSNTLLSPSITKLEGILRKKDNREQLRTFMDKWGFQGMCQIMFFSTDRLRMVSTPFFEEHEHVVSNLEHLGLIKLRSKQISTREGVVEIIWFQITKYAFDLFWACLGTPTGGPLGSSPVDISVPRN